MVVEVDNELLVEEKLVELVLAEVEEIELEVEEKELLVELIEVLELVELCEVLLKLVDEIELLVLEIDVEALVELDEVELIDEEVLEIELLVELVEVELEVEDVDTEVVLTLVEVEEVEALVLEMLEDVLLVEDTEVVVPCGKARRLAIPQAQKFAPLAVKVALYVPTEVTIRSSIAALMVALACWARLTKLPPGVKVPDINPPTPINNSKGWIIWVVAPESKAELFAAPVEILSSTVTVSTPEYSRTITVAVGAIV